MIWSKWHSLWRRVQQPSTLKCCACHGAEVRGVSGGAAVGLLAPRAGLRMIFAHGHLPSCVVVQEVMQRIRQHGRVSRCVINAHSTPRIHDLLSIADQRPAWSIGHALVARNIPAPLTSAASSALRSRGANNGSDSRCARSRFNGSFLNEENSLIGTVTATNVKSASVGKT